MLSGDEIYNPAHWGNLDLIYQTFAAKRRDAPLAFCESKTYPSMWHVTKHSDIFTIEMASDIFLNEPRVFISELREEERIRSMNNGSLHQIRHLLTYDGDEHTKMRRLTQSWFMPKNLSTVDSIIQTSAEKALTALKTKQGECNFAEDVALEYPFRVIMRLLGVAEEDHPRILRATQILFGGQDPKIRERFLPPGASISDARDAAVHDFNSFLIELIKDRMETPRDDLATIIANAEINGKPIDLAAKLGYFIIICTAGHDTTSNTITEAVHQLALNPELLARLKSNPDEIAPKLTEEALRYAAPVRHFIRTANRDFELRGQIIKKDDPVVLWYLSGSRDEDVFPDPDRFDIDRSLKTRHASFGHGPHLCLGMHLARMEITSFLKALASKVKTISLTGAPTYSCTNFVGGIYNLPTRIELV